ncbi:MAG: beta-galactosidase [Candidatus Sulfotelmatobacter sp.]|jgi:beta-galactosidase|nr:beta-galactosidase [Terriglobales bacterium]
MLPSFPLRAIWCLVLVVCASASGQTATPSSNSIPTQIPGQDAILMGTAWYPEQWPESRWEEDLRMMEAANIKVVRIAEFAWSRMEPAESKYDFDWLERAINLAGKHHIISVLGTPTATPPAWLTQKYPDTLRVEANGQRLTHGNRAHASARSPRYREFCRRIAEQMAMRFGHNPNVVGWQIDNEYGYAEMSYDDGTHAQFQDWLKAKYKTLDNLNTHWATAYWSQAYDNWAEIPIPVGEHNPGLMLDWKHFVTYVWTSYQQNQIDVIRKHAEPRQFITGNFMGFFDGFDHYPIAEPLTFASWDDYVGTGHVDPAYNGLAHDLTRGFKRQNFWVMETQPGAVNWSSLNNFLNRGEARAMAWQAIGHGADDVNYWQWRSALNGQEEIHGTLVGADGTPVPFLDEVSQTAHEFAKAESSFRNTAPVSQVALLYSYDSHWAVQFQVHTEKYDDNALLKSYYRSLRQISQSVDVVSAYAPLDGYKLVAAPSLNVLPEDLADHLLAYVCQGGHLVLGPRSGLKDEFNSLLTQRQPGFLVDALGARVEQYYALEKDVPVSGAWGSGEASIWAEQLKSQAPGSEVLLKYGKSNGWLDDQPAVITRAYGKGRITYIGAVLDEKLMAAAAAWMTQESGVTTVFGPVPEGVEVSRRVGPGKQVFVLVNYSQENRRVNLPHSMNLVLEGKRADAVDLAPYGVAVALDPVK